MLERFSCLFRLLWIALPFNEVQHLIAFGIVMTPYYFFYFKIFKDLISLNIIANLMGYAESIDISLVFDCNGFIAKSAP